MATTPAAPEKPIKPRKSPVPQSAERITEGALKLELKQRVELRNWLTDSINAELKEMEEKLTKAKEMLK